MRQRPAAPSSPPLPAKTGRVHLTFVQPVRISSGGAALAGLFQAASSQKVAVLICNPFGQEAIRAQRSLRVVSERLGRQGIPSLRFDYFATGDSPGEDGSGRMSRWRHDIQQADCQLRQLSGCAQTIWMGLGLGGTLALQAAAELAEAPMPRQIILWDPVLDGSAYLQHLSQMHEYWTRQRHVTDEVLGFALPPHLRQRIQAIRPDTFTYPVGAALGLMAAEEHPGREAFAAWANEHTRLQAPPLHTMIEWASNTALASQWVPDEAITALLTMCHPHASA